MYNIINVYDYNDPEVINYIKPMCIDHLREYYVSYLKIRPVNQELNKLSQWLRLKEWCEFWLNVKNNTSSALSNIMKLGDVQNLKEKRAHLSQRLKYLNSLIHESNDEGLSKEEKSKFLKTISNVKKSIRDYCYQHNLSTPKECISLKTSKPLYKFNKCFFCYNLEKFND